MIDTLDKFLRGWNSARSADYYLKSGYVPRLQPEYFEDNIEGIIYQPDVYPFAAYVGEKYNCRYIIDIGCGNGYKLASLHPKFEIIGIDFGVNIKRCSDRYPFGKWIVHDLDIKGSINLPVDVLKSSIIICSDVIEHLKNPEHLLSNISKWMKYSRACIITTPERDLVRGICDMGPPQNPSHVREWNMREFKKLLSHSRLNVQFIGLTINNDRDRQKRTILAIVNNTRVKVEARQRSLNSFKITALMTAYNEEDIIEESIMKLKNQGIDVYVIDNWSTDSTYDIVKELESRGLVLGSERYPDSGPVPYYEWKKLLARVEELASTLDADWFIHHDVDEVRESPWKDLSLKQGIYLVDRMGYNAIDHTVIIFKPTDTDFTGGDFDKYFKYFEFGKRPGHFLQVKAWKNLKKPIDLASSGGHEIRFEGRIIFPYKFLLKHYPIRSQHHGEKKILKERKARWSPEERRNGWHTHYDGYNMGCSFLADAKDLIYYDPGRFFNEFLTECVSGIGFNRQ